ncbi:hypothetical protein ACIBCM_27195 [Streptomyces sp. NPDC051018]
MAGTKRLELDDSGTELDLPERLAGARRAVDSGVPGVVAVWWNAEHA